MGIIASLMERTSPPDVSVVLPVHNERDHVAAEVDRIQRALDSSPHSYEIVAVDDASTDGSAAVLQGLPGIRLIELPRAGGSGSARKIGTRAARGRVIVWTDADMTYPNDRIPWLVRELEGFDQVVGARDAEHGPAKRLRTVTKWAARRLASYLTETEIPDLNSGMRAFRREVGMQYIHLLPKGFSCVTTLTMTFLANGYSVNYVPIAYAPRAGRSKFHWWHDTRRYLLQILRIVLMYNPIKVFMPIGLALVAIGVAKLGFDIVDKDFRVATNTLVIMLAAISVLVIGLLADLMVQLNRSRDEAEPAWRETTT